MLLYDYKHWTVLDKKTDTLMFFLDIKDWKALVYV